jgi:asparagine synthase (glutamine-hydrolysing)
VCGIVGHISTLEIELNEIQKACVSLKHRGPDRQNAVKISDHIGLGHTRLSFLDLGEGGKQPMPSEDEKHWISFNGEIYNYLELREELKTNYNFQSNSDTEVLLAAYKKWGMDMLNRLEGMFAFALLDKEANTLFLARDQFGIKPLYYYQDGQNLIFASELKAFNAFGSFEKQLDFSSMCDYFVYRYVPSPKTIWQNTYKVPPAHYLKIDCNTLKTSLTEYWILESESQACDKKTLVQQVDHALSEGIKKHIRADVPVGAFLSGGYDSSTIATYLHRSNYQALTFSLGFEGWQGSEHPYAKQVANVLGLENQQLILNEESIDEVKHLPTVFDEPIADISVVPTYLLSKLAKQSVKATFSGEGADELFVGYHWQKAFYRLNHPKKISEKFKVLFSPPDPIQFYSQAMAMGQFDRKELKKMLHPRLHTFIPEDTAWFYTKHLKTDWSPLKQIQYLDIKCFMGELVLTKIDRASMANSLEVRVPFLNKQLFENVFSVRENCYFKPNQTKHLLRENIKDKLPANILERPKQGFVGPDSYYMQKAWNQKQLANSCLVADKIIQQSYINDLLQKDYDWRLWKILVFEKWYAHWVSQK